jgi:hypothetical protein
MIGKLFYGNDNEVKSSIDYFKGMKDKDGKVLFTDIVRDGKTGVTVTLADGSKENISFVDANGRPRTQEDFIASAGPLLANQLDVSSSLNRGSYIKGAQFNPDSKGRGTTIQKFKTNPNVISDSSQRAVNNIQSALPEGFIATDTGGTFGNTVEITAPNKKKYIIETKIFGEKAIDAIIGLEDFVNANNNTTETPTSTGGVNLNASKRKGKN